MGLFFCRRALFCCLTLLILLSFKPVDLFAQTPGYQPVRLHRLQETGIEIAVDYLTIQVSNLQIIDLETNVALDVAHIKRLALRPDPNIQYHSGIINPYFALPYRSEPLGYGETFADLHPQQILRSIQPFEITDRGSKDLPGYYINDGRVFGSLDIATADNKTVLTHPISIDLTPWRSATEKRALQTQVTGLEASKFYQVLLTVRRQSRIVSINAATAPADLPFSQEEINLIWFVREAMPENTLTMLSGRLFATYKTLRDKYDDDVERFKHQLFELLEGMSVEVLSPAGAMLADDLIKDHILMKHCNRDTCRETHSSHAFDAIRRRDLLKKLGPEGFPLIKQILFAADVALGSIPGFGAVDIDLRLDGWAKLLHLLATPENVEMLQDILLNWVSRENPSDSKRHLRHAIVFMTLSDFAADIFAAPERLSFFSTSLTPAARNYLIKIISTNAWQAHVKKSEKLPANDSRLSVVVRALVYDWKSRGMKEDDQVATCFAETMFSQPLSPNIETEYFPEYLNERRLDIIVRLIEFPDEQSVHQDKVVGFLKRVATAYPADPPYDPDFDPWLNHDMEDIEKPVNIDTLGYRAEQYLETIRRGELYGFVGEQK